MKNVERYNIHLQSILLHLNAYNILLLKTPKNVRTEK